MYRSRIHLLGGGPGSLVSLRRNLRAALFPLGGAQKPLVAYVGAASGDDTGFQSMVGREIERAGGRIRGVKLASPRAKVSAARALLEDADVVFVSGGDVEAGMDVLRQRGVVTLVRRLAEQGRPMIGISAGSIMLGRAWVRFSDGPHATEEASAFECLGVAPVYVDAHAEEDGWVELKELLRLVGADDADAVGYGLTREGGLLLEPGEPPRVRAIGTDAPRFAKKNGRVSAIKPLRLDESTEADAPRRTSARR